MRRTRLNIVPPVPKVSSSSVARGTMIAEINGHELVSVNSNTLPTAQVTVPIVMQNNAVETPVKENRSQRVRRLQEEARLLAREQIAEFEATLNHVATMAEEIAEGGDMYHIGAREICRRLAEELPRSLQTLQAIIKKT